MSDIRIIAYDPSTHAVVPKEATDAMRIASGDCAGPWDEWRAMVSAAPPPPPVDVVKRLEWARGDDGALVSWTPLGFFSVAFDHDRQSYDALRCLGRICLCDSEESALIACQREFDRLVSDCLAGTVGGGG